MDSKIDLIKVWEEACKMDNQYGSSSGLFYCRMDFFIKLGEGNIVLRKVIGTKTNDCTYSLNYIAIVQPIDEKTFVRLHKMLLDEISKKNEAVLLNLLGDKILKK